jgi:hypothetical protein
VFAAEHITPDDAILLMQAVFALSSPPPFACLPACLPACLAAECITPDDVMELMEEDVKAADLVLWVGISFQQSASTMYFRKVRAWIQVGGWKAGMLLPCWVLCVCE